MEAAAKVRPDTASIRLAEMLPRLDALVDAMNEAEPERRTDRTAIVKAALRKFMPELEKQYGIETE